MLAVPPSAAIELSGDIVPRARVAGAAKMPTALTGRAAGVALVRSICCAAGASCTDTRGTDPSRAKASSFIVSCCSDLEMEDERHGLSLVRELQPRIGGS